MTPLSHTEPWYPIAAMRWARLPVEIARAGYQHAAIVLADKPSGRLHWYMVTPAGKIGDRFARYNVAADRSAPERWRPLAGHAWPHPLPEPIADMTSARPPGQHAAPPDAEPEDATTPGDGWPYPGLRLGQCVPPVSIAECEARLLRALRTSASRETGSVGLAHRSTCADIPSEYVKIALKHERAEALRLGLYSPETHAVRSGWTPLHRDIEDWAYALDWLAVLAWDDPVRRVLEMRAADPPFSFRGIAEQMTGRRRRMKTSAQALHAAYGRALTIAFERARAG